MAQHFSLHRRRLPFHRGQQHQSDRRRVRSGIKRDPIHHDDGPERDYQFQDAYVEKVIDTLNDLPNVLRIVSEEAPSDSMWWNDHQISHIRTYDSGRCINIRLGTLPS